MMMQQTIFEWSGGNQICSLGRTIEIIEVRYRKKDAARRNRVIGHALTISVTVKMNVAPILTPA